MEEDVVQGEGSMYTRGRPGDEDKRGSSMVFVYCLQLDSAGCIVQIELRVQLVL